MFCCRSGFAVCCVVKEFDTNGDGSIDFEEFMNMMRGGAPAEEIPNATPFPEIGEIFSKVFNQYRNLVFVYGFE